MFWINKWYEDYTYNKKYPTKESVVEEYLNLVVKGDKEGISSISPYPGNVEQIIDEKIKLYSGKKPSDLHTKYTLVGLDHSFLVTMEELKTDSQNPQAIFVEELAVERFERLDPFSSQLSDPVPLDQHKGRWYVITKSNCVLCSDDNIE